MLYPFRSRVTPGAAKEMHGAPATLQTKSSVSLLFSEIETVAVTAPPMSAPRAVHDPSPRRRTPSHLKLRCGISPFLSRRIPGEPRKAELYAVCSCPSRCFNRATALFVTRVELPGSHKRAC